MNQRKLTNDDYLVIFPLATPQEIKEEFGEYAHCVSQIRNKYSKTAFGSQFKAFKHFQETILKQKPPSVSMLQWKAHSRVGVAQAKQEKFALVWDRLRAREGVLRGQD